MVGNSRGRSKEIPTDPYDAATYWTARRRLGTSTHEDEAAFEGWLAHPAHAAAYAEVCAPVDAIGELAGDPAILEMRRAALAAAPARRRRTAPSRLVVGGLIAAGAAGVVVLASFTLSRPGAPPPPAAPRPSPSAANAAVKTYATGVGERLNVTLDDGSTVELDTASRLEVAYSAARRELRLVAGQALFQVAHNKARPFIVTAGDRRITATGTAFEVRLDGRRVRVVLVEGHVVVADAAPGQAVPSAGQELSAGEQLVARPAGPMSVGPADLDRTSSWRRGQLIFRDDTLQAAVAEFNRYTTTRLVVDDPAVAALKISGVFGSASTDDFIAAIEAYFPVDAEMRATGTIALVKRPGTVASARR